MKVTQIRNSSNSSAASLKTTGFKQLLAVGSVAIGIAAIIPAAPSQAVSLAGGQLNFTGFTSDFYFAPGASPTSFNVTFNPTSKVASVGSSIGAFAPVIPTGNYTIAPLVLTFTQTTPGLNELEYQLTSGNLDFNSLNGVRFNILKNSVFQGSYTKQTGAITGISFTLIDNAGSYYTSGTDVTNTNALSFSFNDIVATGSGGGYTTQSSTNLVSVPTTSVPEPFSIIGTLVGGTAAFRMRNKLSDVAKK